MPTSLPQFEQPCDALADRAGRTGNGAADSLDLGERLRLIKDPVPVDVAIRRVTTLARNL